MRCLLQDTSVPLKALAKVRRTAKAVKYAIKTFFK